MGYQVEDVAFKDIHKPTFFALCSAYSLVDAVLFHPLSVAAVVAELHRSTTAAGAAAVAAPAAVPLTFMQKLRSSFKANLTIRQSIDKIVNAAGAASAPATTGALSRRQYLRLVGSAVFTGFPVTYAGLFLYDVFQMMPYNYFKSWLKEKQGEGAIPSYLPAPVLSGVFSTLMCTPFVNPPTVLFRQQVQHRCMGQPYNLRWILGTRLPAMEGGVTRVLFRGSFVGIVTAVPSTALGWQLYESTRQYFEKRFDSQSVYISVISGAIAGVVGVTFTRPISVVVSRMQTDSQSHRFFATAKAIFKSEGIGAFYKGYLARIMATAPRNGIFFSAYQSIITLAKNDPVLPEESVPPLAVPSLGPIGHFPVFVDKAAPDEDND
jgi:hypothetical protein